MLGIRSLTTYFDDDGSVPLTQEQKEAVDPIDIDLLFAHEEGEDDYFISKAAAAASASTTGTKAMQGSVSDNHLLRGSVVDNLNPASATDSLVAAEEDGDPMPEGGPVHNVLCQVRELDINRSH